MIALVMPAPVAAPGPVAAAPPAAASAADPRIRTIPFVPDQVVPLQVAPGFATLVELSPDDRIETVVLGSGGPWQVTPTKSGTRLAIKPLPGASRTDLIVTTGTRRYVFLLDPGGATAPFVVRFAYPAPAAAADPPAAMTASYRLSGAKRLFPLVMGDDGHDTVIGWPADVVLPAIYAVDRDGHPRAVNARMEGDHYVVQGIAPRYLFRSGHEQARAVRLTAGAAE